MSRPAAGYFSSIAIARKMAATATASTKAAFSNALPSGSISSMTTSHPRAPDGSAAPHAGIALEDRYQILIDAVRDYAIFMLDAQGRVASWNSGAQRIKGYSLDEIVGRHFSVFYTQEDVDSDK